MNKKTKNLLFFILLIFIMGCGNKSSEENQNNADDFLKEHGLYPKPADAAYDVKSGIVTFENVIAEGVSRVFYFDDYGRKEAWYTVMNVEIMGEKNSTGNVEIQVDSFFTRYDLQSKEGTKIISHISIGGAKDIPKDFSKLTREFIEDFQLKELGTRNVLGKECKGYGVTAIGIKTEIWVWNGIVLYSRIFMSKDAKPMEMRASKLEINVSIPAEKFQVPSEINIISIGIDG